jgi:hypothetical protein
MNSKFASKFASSEAAGERYFRLYYKRVTQADMDTLFNLLEAMHSLNDRLKKETDRDFFDIEEFYASTRSASAWMAKAAGAITSSLSGCGAR